MKSKEFIAIIASVVLVLLFTAWIFNFQNEMDKSNLMRSSVANDSVIIAHQKKLDSTDSVLMNRIYNQEKKVKRLYETVRTLRLSRGGEK